MAFTIGDKRDTCPSPPPLKNIESKKSSLIYTYQFEFYVNFMPSPEKIPVDALVLRCII